VLNKELISESIPTLTVNDTVSRALQLMADHHLSHLPVVSGNHYIGLVNEEGLMNTDDNEPVSGKNDSNLSQLAVNGHLHFTEAVKLCTGHNLSVVPVIEKNAQWMGAISRPDLLKELAHTAGIEEPGGIIVLELEQKTFSFSELSKLVETNDAEITQLNSFFDKDLGVFFITIKVNKFEISDIVATFQRYEYTVRYYFGEELFENELKSNYDHLMNYLNI
jgi:acetoin utilization protein AcuB